MRPPLLVAALAALALLLVACGEEATPSATPSQTSPSESSPSPSVSASPLPPGSPSPSPTPTAESGPELEAYLALCSVAADVAVEDLAGAEATFHDEVHDALHDLADQLEEVDRELSAALLQAKSKVEAEFADGEPDPATLTGDLAELVSATEQGLAAVGVDASGCPEQPL